MDPLAPKEPPLPAPRAPPRVSSQPREAWKLQAVDQQAPQARVHRAPLALEAPQLFPLHPSHPLCQARLIPVRQDPARQLQRDLARLPQVKAATPLPMNPAKQVPVKRIQLNSARQCQLHPVQGARRQPHLQPHQTGPCSHLQLLLPPSATMLRDPKSAAAAHQRLLAAVYPLQVLRYRVQSIQQHPWLFPCILRLLIMQPTTSLHARTHPRNSSDTMALYSISPAKALVCQTERSSISQPSGQTRAAKR